MPSTSTRVGMSAACWLTTTATGSPRSTPVVSVTTAIVTDQVATGQVGGLRGATRGTTTSTFPARVDLEERGFQGGTPWETTPMWLRHLGVRLGEAEPKEPVKKANGTTPALFRTGNAGAEPLAGQHHKKAGPL